MITSEHASQILEPILTLNRLTTWSRASQIKIEGEAPSLLEERDHLEGFLVHQIERVEGIIERMPGYPVDEQVVGELFRLLNKLEEMPPTEEILPPHEYSKTHGDMESNLRVRLEETIDLWRIAEHNYKEANRKRKESIKILESQAD
jgi:hypothetical protein